MTDISNYTKIKRYLGIPGYHTDKQTERRNEMTGQYCGIAVEEINDAAEHDPQRALLMVLANATLADAEQKAAGEKSHESKFHESGWSIAIETPQGIVGLWSCWLKNQFYLGYPKRTTFLIADQLIMDTLGVERARPVLQVDATAVDENYEGEYKDTDKPLVKNVAGQNVAYRTREPRLWANFFSPQVADNKGRVWVEHSDWNSNSHHFEVVRDDSNEGVENSYHGHGQSCGISTFPFSFWNEYAPDGPTTESEVIQSYREKFLALACEVARLIGGANAVNINYGFVLVPEQLQQLGYGNIAWLKGMSGVRQGWGHEVVRAEKTTESGQETVILKSGNSLVPWSTIRRAPCASDLTAEKLIELLTF